MVEAHRGQYELSELSAPIHHKGTKDTKVMDERANELSKEIIGAAIAFDRELGPGLLESAYEACLEYELFYWIGG